ncbi:MAG: hypothetical protein ACIAQZ_00400 [Sedimentisphaeraceae bacterium JB056]
MVIKTICRVCIFIILVSCLSVLGEVYSTTDLLDGNGCFEFDGSNGPWTLWADGGESSTISSDLAYSGAYAWKAGPTVSSSKNIRAWTSVETFANRSHKIVAYARCQGSSPSYARVRLGSASWSSTMNITSNAFGYFAESTLYQSTAADEISPNLTLAMYSNSANDTLYMDDISVYRERCIPDPNEDSVGGVLTYGERTLVTIDADETTGSYTVAFDPDITVSSPYAIIHSYQWLSDTQIEVDLTAIYAGDIILTLRNESSNLEATHTMTSSYQAGAFTLDSDEFPIIFFDSADTSNATETELIRTCGVTHVQRFSHCSSDVSSSINELQSYLDNAEAHGLKVMVNLRGRKWALETDGVSSVEQIATAVKDHDAFGFWFLIDEPEVRDRDTTDDYGDAVILPFYNALKTLTPNVPVGITHAQREQSATYANWWDYDNCEDIFFTDRYPVNDELFPDAPVDSSTNWLGTAMDVSPDSVVPSLQLHNRLSFGVGAWPEITEDCRFPNAAEVRYWCYASVIKGSRALSWYSYYRSIYPDGTSAAKTTKWLEETFRPVGQEVRKLSYLAAPFHQPEVILDGGTASDNLYMAVWPRSTGYWVALVNGTGIGKNVTIDTSSKLVNAGLKPWGLTRQTESKIVNGLLDIHIEPWETLIWRAQLSGDLNNDDYVDFLDLQEVMLDWLDDSYPLSE